MEDFIVEVLNRFGYFGIYFLIMLESLFPPLPAESVMLITGFASNLDGADINPWLVALSATLGSLSGALILYFIATLFSFKRLDNLIKKRLPKMISLRRGLAKTFAFFYKYNQSAVFFGRFLPVVRPMISVPAGMSRMPLIPFVVLTFLGCGIFNTFYVFMGNTLGNFRQQLFDFAKENVLLLSIIAGVLLLAIIAVVWRKRSLVKAEVQESQSKLRAAVLRKPRKSLEEEADD